MKAFHLLAFRDNAMSSVQIKMWHKYFKDGWESVESDTRSGRPATRTPENVECVQVAMNKNQRLTGQKLEADLGIPKTAVRDFDTGPWHKTCCANVHSIASATRAEGTSCCSCWWFDSNHYQGTRFPQGHNQRWLVGLRLWCGNEGPVVQWKLPGFPPRR